MEFTPCRKDNFELVAKDVIDLGPSSYSPPKGIVKKEKYPTNHLERKSQWDSIPYWYHPVGKTHGPMNEMPRVKPLLYKDAKWKGKY